MFCIECGKQIPDGAKFCSNCGANQNPDTATEPIVKEQAAPATPEIDISKTFSEFYGAPQQNPQPIKKKKKSKIKKLSAKLKGFLITLLVFLVTFGIRHVVTNGMEGFFGFISDSIKETQSKTYEELDQLMSELDLVVTGYNRGYWEEDGETGPLIQVFMKNNSGKTVSSVKVAIATWDKSGNPIYLTHTNGPSSSNTAYLTLEGCFWAAGTTYNDKGLALNINSQIPERIQAIPVSWTYSDGEKGSNPYAEDWFNRYENKDNTRSDLSQIQFPQDLVLSETELLTALLEQPLVSTNYEIAQWSEGDLLCATITNNSDVTIKTMYVAYAVWDENNNPVIPTLSSGKQMSSNIIKINMSDLSLAPGESYGADFGAALHGDSAKVAKFVAIAYYFEDSEGNIWENPYYWAWINQYEGK